MKGLTQSKCICVKLEFYYVNRVLLNNRVFLIGLGGKQCWPAHPPNNHLETLKALRGCNSLVPHEIAHSQCAPGQAYSRYGNLEYRLQAQHESNEIA